MKKYKYSIIADENVSEDTIHCLKTRGLIVESVKDLNMQGRGDNLILKIANERRAFLLTTNYKDFFNNDTDYPFHGLTGIIAIPQNICFCDEIAYLLKHEKENITGKKYKYGLDGITIKLEDGRRKKETHKFNIEDCPHVFKESIKNWKR